MFDKNNIKICVIGLGYIGLPTAAVLANSGFKVCGVDIQKNVVDTINKGNIHIIEPGLRQVVKDVVGKGRLYAKTKIEVSDVYIICVPTPFVNETEIKPDLSFVMGVIDDLTPKIKSGDLILLESTSPVGTTEIILNKLEEKGIDISSINLAYCPERVLPGNVLHELLENDRVVGGVNSTSTNKAALFYKSFVRGEIFQTNAKTAELCKLTENSFRDVNIAFANELSVICAEEGINVWELIELTNKHPRVNVLQPGTGVGGHCISVDPWFIVSRNPSNSKLIQTARAVNNFKPKWVVENILNVLGHQNFRGNKPKVACLGISYKPDIDDLRESPALEVVRGLKNSGCDVLVVEPNIIKSDEFEFFDLEVAIQSADLIVSLVAHSSFKKLKCIQTLKKLEALDYCGLLKTG